MSIGVAAAANKVEREKDEREEGERASERMSGAASDLAYLIYPRCAARWTDGRRRTTGEWWFRLPSFLRPLPAAMQ